MSNDCWQCQEARNYLNDRAAEMPPEQAERARVLAAEVRAVLAPPDRVDVHTALLSAVDAYAAAEDPAALAEASRRVVKAADAVASAHRDTPRVAIRGEVG